MPMVTICEGMRDRPGLGVCEVRVQFLTDIPPNQQGHEGADRGVVELGCHPVQAFVYLIGVELVGKLFVDLVSHVLQVCPDLGSTWVGIEDCRTGHTYKLSPAHGRREGSLW
jgi:hypothetical protein